MRDPMIKFSCSIEELKSALQKVGVKNPEIEKDEDVASAVSFLLAAKNIHAIEPIINDCSSVKDRATIVVTRVAVAPSIGFPITSADFVEAVKELQKMIFGEKDR